MVRLWNKELAILVVVMRLTIGLHGYIQMLQLILLGGFPPSFTSLLLDGQRTFCLGMWTAFFQRSWPTTTGPTTRPALCRSHRWTMIFGRGSFSWISMKE